MEPRTIYELLELLERYHLQRHDNYQQLAARAADPRTQLLLEHLSELEQDAIRIVRDEREHLNSKAATYLSSGPTLTIEPTHATDCRCDSNPSFQDALWCALTSDEAFDEVIDRLAGSSAAESVQELAARLRELERTKDRQIAKFTRED